MAYKYRMNAYLRIFRGVAKAYLYIKHECAEIVSLTKFHILHVRGKVGPVPNHLATMSLAKAACKLIFNLPSNIRSAQQGVYITRFKQ